MFKSQMFPPWYHRKPRDSQKHVTMNCFNNQKYKKQKWKRRIFKMISDFFFLIAVVWNIIAPTQKKLSESLSEFVHWSRQCKNIREVFLKFLYEQMGMIRRKQKNLLLWDQKVIKCIGRAKIHQWLFNRRNMTFLGGKILSRQHGSKKVIRV